MDKRKGMAAVGCIYKRKILVQLLEKLDEEADQEFIKTLYTNVINLKDSYR